MCPVVDVFVPKCRATIQDRQHPNGHVHRCQLDVQHTTHLCHCGTEWNYVVVENVVRLSEAETLRSALRDVVALVHECNFDGSWCTEHRNVTLRDGDTHCRSGLDPARLAEIRKLAGMS